ncbi:putative tail fiber protein [Achromobacter phage vB_AxyP_19-32_Axy23]|uniref:Putative tail fiber protein n=1 Tax=Achromobacter phage vB_AxyP_19-32_Axy23 TaxID=2591047 RepID=A0A514CW37_9CAUD|nr:putative tail fiber protein [Achromobacter phage vB_AxyP_19-32_Axy23]
MQLIDAVNTILPALGEHTVTQIDPRHPTVVVILNALQNRLEDALLETWWFNNYDATFYADSEGEIALPGSILTILPTDPHVRTAERNGRAFDLTNRTYKWPPGYALNVRITEKLEFNELPETVARMVMYEGLIHAYSTDIGLEDVLSEWGRKASQAKGQVEAEHLRNRKFSTRKSFRFARLQRARRL